MRIIGQLPFLFSQVHEKAVASDAIGGDSLTVNDYGSTDELAEVIPIECYAILEFPHQEGGIESIARLPELQDNQAPDKRLVKRPGRECAEVVDVASLVPLIARADFLRDDLGQCEAGDPGGRKGQLPEVALFALGSAFCRQRGRFAAADLEPHLAFPAAVPGMGIGGIDAPRQTVLRLVVAVVRNAELNAVKGLREGIHHIENDRLMVVLLQGREVQIGRKASLAADDHFANAGAALERESIKHAAL